MGNFRRTHAGNLGVGEYGENLVLEWVRGEARRRRWAIYRPDEGVDCAHVGDLLLATLGAGGVTGLNWLEIKTKPARASYPDTGINTNEWARFEFDFKTRGIDTLIVFVDYGNGPLGGYAYGEMYSRLREPVAVEHMGRTLEYPQIGKAGHDGWQLVYWPLAKMRRLFAIAPADLMELRRLAGKNGDNRDRRGFSADMAAGV